MFRASAVWVGYYQRRNAYWLHDGNPKRPHALLTSGLHSNGFFNSRLVIPDDALMREAARDLTDELTLLLHGELNSVGVVVGPQTGATKLAEFVRNDLVGTSPRKCLWMSPEKKEEGGKKSIVFTPEEVALLKGKTVLFCDDVFTTGGSIDLTVEAVTNAGGRVLPFVLVLVNRSGLKAANGKEIVALIDQPMPTWTAEECPLCKEGSEAIRPKGTEEWTRLNAEY